MLSRQELDLLRANLHKLSTVEQQEVLDAVEELERREHIQKCQDDFLEFCLHMDPDYKVGAHHRRLAKLSMQLESRVADRIAVSVPPRHGKSHMISTLFPAWYLGRRPTEQVMLVSHTADLAVDFGRKVRNLIGSDRYAEIFPNVNLAADSKSAGRWNTNHGGQFYATGVGSALAGRGAHCLIIDDPFSEQDILSGNYTVFEKAYEWFTFGARTRLMKEGVVAIVHTRWAPGDLIGRLAKDMATKEGVDQYEFFEFPAILNENTPNEKALWPEFFNLDALHRTKASMPLFQWNAQYQQNPTGEAGAIVRREDWRQWELDDPPACEYVIIALDAAAEKTTRSDFTALLVWGVFRHERLTEGAAHLILLDAINERLEFPELKRLAYEQYRKWQPDSFIVEKKSSGIPLYQEMRRSGVPVTEFTPSRASGDKVMRLNAVADIFRSGMVWYPQGRRWAQEVVEQIAAFPAVEHDDMVDCTSMALARFRQGGFIRLPSDYDDEPDIRMPRRAAYY